MLLRLLFVFTFLWSSQLKAETPTTSLTDDQMRKKIDDLNTLMKTQNQAIKAFKNAEPIPTKGSACKTETKCPKCPICPTDTEFKAQLVESQGRVGRLEAQVSQLEKALSLARKELEAAKAANPFRSGEQAVASTPAPIPASPSPMANEEEKNLVIVHLGIGNDGVQKTQNADGSFAVEPKLSPIVGVTYNRTVYESWTASVTVFSNKDFAAGVGKKFALDLF